MQICKGYFGGLVTGMALSFVVYLGITLFLLGFEKYNYAMETRRFWGEDNRDEYSERLSRFDHEDDFINDYLIPLNGPRTDPSRYSVCQGSRFKTVPFKKRKAGNLSLLCDGPKGHMVVYVDERKP
ncbi:MAG: hypothetical protein EOP04_00785 [Proteobacteria bacterium]|nr:MAG: hypothetical protein EOP04_00785 [Pseudomonadota bacterium]